MAGRPFIWKATHKMSKSLNMKKKQHDVTEMDQSTHCKAETISQDVMALLFSSSRWLVYLLSGCDDKVLVDAEMRNAWLLHSEFV